MIHIMIDGYYGSENELNDMQRVNAVINEIIEKCGVKAVMPPFLLPYYYAKDGDDDGISAFALLEGGHITVHTFPYRGCVFADLLYDGFAEEADFDAVLRDGFRFTDEKKLWTERRWSDPTINPDKIWNGKQTTDFGPHILAKVENVDITFEEIFDALDRLPQQINMLPICRPYVIKSSADNPAYISGIVLIAQSHIAFHYCVAERVLFCDAFSCSFYKIENFIDYLQNRFGDNIHTTIIRGSKHENKIGSRRARIEAMSAWAENAKR